MSTYDFKAKNSMSTKQLFDNRKDYRDNALYDDGEWGTGVYDFFIEKGLPFYGRIDEKNNAVMLKERRTRPFKIKRSLDGSTIRAADFVVAAFEAFIKEFESAIQENQCGLSAEDIKLKIKRAWLDTNRYRQPHIRYYVRGFNNYYFKPDANASYHVKLEKMTTFEQFVDKAIEYLSLTGAGGRKLTASGICTSKTTSLSNSGLCIEFQEFKHSDDEEKSTFMNETVFEYYQLAAAKHGFVINRNAPWQIIANIESEAMQSHMETYDTSLERIYETHYEVAHHKDLDLLKPTLLKMWNSLARQYPRCRQKGETICPSGKRTRKYVKREQYSNEQFANEYGNPYWLSVYARVKNAETGNVIKKVSLRRIIKHAIQLEKTLDMTSAMDYINEQYKPFLYNTNLNPDNFRPGANRQIKGNVSEHQSNVVIESETY